VTVHLLKGEDPILRTNALDALVDELLDGDDRTLALEDVTVPGRTEGAEARATAVDAVLNAAHTPPFMTEGRVVVVRDVGALTAEEAKPLVAYLDDPLPTTHLVLVIGGGTIPKSLEERAKKTGTVTAPQSEKPADVLSDALRDVGLRLDGDAVDALRAHAGTDAGLLPGLVDTLVAVHGDERELGVDDITPYLGEAGSIPSWDLTNAIEKGDIPGALVVLRRLQTVTSPTQPRPMHALQVLGLLHGHYRRLLRLDDPAISSAEEAAAALGGRANPNSARFRLRQARALGSDGIREAFGHLARADLDLKGRRAIPQDVVMEVLVARLARLGGRTTTAKPRGGQSGRGRRRSA
jgi:DNA polymerase-3 subunit delta